MRILRILYLLFFFCLSIKAWTAEKRFIVFWKVDLTKEILKNKYSFSEIAEYLYQSTENKKIFFYSDSSCKNKIIKDELTQDLYERNQSVAGYAVIRVAEEWLFTDKGILSKVTHLSFENPNLPEKDPYRILYIPQKYLTNVLKDIRFSGYYQGRANVPLAEWIKKHDFEYQILKTSATLPVPPYNFLYDKNIDNTDYKEIEILFDFFPAKNSVFNYSYTRNKNIEENFTYLQTYPNESQDNTFRTILLEALQKNKLLKNNQEVEEILKDAPVANYLFYFDALYTASQIEWSNIRVYVDLGRTAFKPHVLCADVPKNKIKNIENYFKEKTQYSFTEFFTKVKIDILVSHVNNSYAKDAEEGLMLRQYIFHF